MTIANAEQIKHWNDVVGPIWRENAEEVGAQLRPIGERARTTSID